MVTLLDGALHPPVNDPPSAQRSTLILGTRSGRRPYRSVRPTARAFPIFAWLAHLARGAAHRPLAGPAREHAGPESERALSGRA